MRFRSLGRFPAIAAGKPLYRRVELVGSRIIVLRGDRGVERLVFAVGGKPFGQLGPRGVGHGMVAFVEHDPVGAIQHCDLLKLDAAAVVGRQDEQHGVHEPRAAAEPQRRAAAPAREARP